MMRLMSPTLRASLFLALPAAMVAVAAPALGADAPEEIEVVDSKPAAKRPSKPSLRLNMEKLPEINLQSRVIDFPTGLRFIMQSDQSHPYVSVFTVVDHGAGDDPEGKNGTAHFVEHTWFRSEHGDLPPIMDVIQDLGTQFNATTRPDTTDFRTVASSEYLPVLMRLESLRLTEPYIGMSEEEVETEREVIRNEWRRRNEQSSALVFDYLLKSVFPQGHPYANRETNESLDNIDLATLQGYFDDHYKPENTTIVVIGDFDQAEARSLIFSNFDLSVLDPDLKPEHLIRYPKPGVENPDPENPDHWLTDAMDPRNADRPYPEPDPTKRKPRVTENTPYPPLPMPPNLDEIPEYEAAVDNQIVGVGWAMPGAYRGHDTEMQALAQAASIYMNQKLFSMNMLDYGDTKRGLTGVGCFVQPMKMHSIFACFAEVTDTKRWKDPKRVGDLMVDQLPELWNPERAQLNEVLFSRAKLEQMAYVFRSLDTVAIHFGGRGEDIGFHAHQTGSVTYHSDAINDVSSLDFQKVSQLAYEHLERDRAAYVIINPIPESEVDKTAETSSYHGASEGDAVINASDALAEVTEEDVISAYVKPDLGALVDKRLANGMRVVILPHGESPLAQATLLLGGGNDVGEVGMHNLAGRFAADDWYDGRSGNDPLQIAAERTGAQWGSSRFAADSYAYHNASGVRVPASNLDGALWMMREGVETLRPDFNGKGTWAKKQVESMGKNFHSRAWHISDMSQRHLYPDSPHDWPLQWDTVQNYVDISPSDAKAYQHRIVQPKNATLVIVGNVDKDETLRLVVDYFGGWENPADVELGPVTVPEPPAMAEGSKVLVFDNPKRTQTQVSYECRLHTEGVQDIQATSVLSNLVFDRTFSQLRVKEGLAYSPGGFASASPNGTAQLTFSSLAVNSGVGRTLEFFRDFTQKIEDGGIDDEVLTRYKLRRARSHGVQAQSTSQMTGKLVSVLRWGQPWSMLTDAGEDIASVDAATLQRMVNGCNSRAIATLEGPADVITPQLEERGIAYEVVDYKARGDELHEKFDPKGYKKYAKKRAKDEKKNKDTDEAETTDGSADSE